MILPISLLLVRSITKFKDQALFALGEMIGEILGILSFRDNSHWRLLRGLVRGLRRAARFARLHPPPLAALAPRPAQNSKNENREKIFPKKILSWELKILQQKKKKIEKKKVIKEKIKKEKVEFTS